MTADVTDSTANQDQMVCDKCSRGATRGPHLTIQATYILWLLVRVTSPRAIRGGVVLPECYTAGTKDSRPLKTVPASDLFASTLNLRVLRIASQTNTETNLYHDSHQPLPSDRGVSDCDDRLFGHWLPYLDVLDLSK